MKKSTILTAALSSILLFTLIPIASSTAQQDKAKSVRQQKAEEERRAREEAERAVKRAEMEKKIRQQLRQFEQWIIYLVPTGANPAKVPIGKDILTFTDVSVTSQYLSEKGFRNSNYSLSANDDGTGVWETMQRNNNGDIAFWKGQVKDMIMHGVLGLQPKKGQMQEFSFTIDKPAGYIEPAPKKEESKAKKGEAAAAATEVTNQSKASPKIKN